MHNLLLFIIKYGTFLTFLLLEALCFYFVVKFNDTQKNIFFYSSNVLSGNVYDQLDNFKKYINLEEENNRLALENAKLKSKMIAEGIVISDSSLLLQNSFQYILQPSRIINNSIDRRNNTLTINRGFVNNIKKSQGVINDLGVIGIVVGVSENFATVYSLLHGNIKISGKIARNDYFGTVSWDGKDIRYVQLDAIPKHANIKRGDTIRTTAYSTIFPPDIDIGIVEEFEVKAGRNDYAVRVRLFNDFARIKEVYVVDMPFSEERKRLERNE